MVEDRGYLRRAVRGAAGAAPQGVRRGSHSADAPLSETGCTIAGPCRRVERRRRPHPPRRREPAPPGGRGLHAREAGLAPRYQRRPALEHRHLRRASRADARSASHVGEETRNDCPVCCAREARVARLRLRRHVEAESGRVWSIATALRMAAAHPGSCLLRRRGLRSCSWNHLREAYSARRPPPTG